MASSNDLIRYVTKEFVRSLDHPKAKRERKKKEPVETLMFGMIPISLQLTLDKIHRRGKKKEE